MQYIGLIEDYILQNHIIGKLATIFLLYIAFKIVRILLHKLLSHAETKGMDTSAKPLVESLVSYALNILMLLLSLHILGVNTAGIVAMVGAASLAVGLALKDMLTNIASGILLLFLRPFKAGDYIECGSIKGKISGIGLFNTTFETLDGLYVSAPNGSLWGAPIVNFSKNEKRRVEITVGIAYDTDVEKASEVILSLFAEEPKFLKTPAPEVFVSDLSDSAVTLTARAWAKTPDFFSLKIQYTAAIKKAFQEKGIEIPFPQRVIHLVKEKEET